MQKNFVFGDKNLLSYTSNKKYSVTQLCDIKDQSMNLRRHIHKGDFWGTWDTKWHVGKLYTISS